MQLGGRVGEVGGGVLWGGCGGGSGFPLPLFSVHLPDRYSFPPIFFLFIFCFNLFCVLLFLVVLVVIVVLVLVL